MKIIKQFLITALTLAVALAPGASIAPEAAHAAGLKVYIDDTPANNGGIACPGATLTSDLSTQNFSANTTVYICPGTYTGELYISEDNVRIYGKGYPTINPGAGDDKIIHIYTALGFVIQGLVLDGADLFSIDYPYGIYSSESTGTISGNYIIRMRRYPISTTCSGGAGIRIDSAPGPVKIVGNTVHDFQCHGIVVYRATNPLIQRNRVWGTSRIGEGNDGINVYDSINATVSSNSVSSDWTSEMTSQIFWGISVTDAPGAKVAGNKLSHVSSGVFVAAQCGAIVWGNPDNVQITGNKITGAYYTVLVQVEEHPGDSCTSTANNVTIKGNTLIYPLLVGWLPVRVNSIDHDAGDTELPSVAGLVMTGNKYTAGVDFFTSSGSGIVVQTNTKNTPVPPPAGQ